MHNTVFIFFSNLNSVKFKSSGLGMVMYILFLKFIFFDKMKLECLYFLSCYVMMLLTSKTIQAELPVTRLKI
jgi:hypothetical protein